MGTELRFDGRVAIITGAGGGLGRAHALLLAARGAKVVVNDLGGTFTGEGKSQAAADQVVEEIRAAGGEAVASYSSVEDGDAIVRTALDAWGRVDILINNAGILRDVSFPKMTQDDWDLVYKVHVLGSFRVTHAAWPIMRDQGYGRIVMTASAAGIYGNFGQANYSMAKLGLAGFANTLAIEGRRRNILVNTIAPIAGSRMTETVLPPDLIAALKPDYVSPLVARLCHESSEETGGLFEVGGGFYAKLRWERSSGTIIRLGRKVAIEDIDRRWQEIKDFSKTTHPDSVVAAMQPIMDNVAAGPSKGGNEIIDVDLALGYRYPEVQSSYEPRDVSLYALGVGAAANPMDESELRLVYELHPAGMQALPTYGAIPGVNVLVELVRDGKQAPGLHYGFDRVLHGEQYTELMRPLPAKATLTHRARVKDIFDKGKNALVVTEVVSYDEDGNALIRNELTMLIRGAGGWGGERGPSTDINVPPERAPDAVVEETVPASQALLYRLSGDWNPLHADPGFARAMGFERPILHGLCTYGYACRHVIKTFAPGKNPDFIKSIGVRFAGSVIPGETLVTEMWKESDTRIVLRTKVKERDAVVLSNAAVELHREIPKAKTKTKPQAKADAAAVPEAPSSRDVFIAIQDHVERNPGLVAKIGTVYLFKLKNPDSAWTLDLKNGGVSEGEAQPPDCTLEISENDFLDMTSGKADAMKLFTTGKLRISGNIMASQKLEFLKQIDPQQAKAAVARARAAGHGAADAGAKASAADTGAKASAAASQQAAMAPAIMDALVQRLACSPESRGDLRAVVLLRVAEPDGVWVIDLARETPTVQPGEAAGMHTVLTIRDVDLAALVQGQSTARELFQQGKLRVDGDIAVARKLDFLTGLI